MVSPEFHINRLTYGNGFILGIQRDKRYAPLTIQVGGAPALLPPLNLAYAYNSAGNITDIWNNLDPNRDQSFDYDLLNQLTYADGSYGSYAWQYDHLGNRTRQVFVPPLPESPVAQTTDYSYLAGANQLSYSVTQDPPVAASYSNYVLTLVYPKHHLPQGQPLDDQYVGLLSDLTGLLDRADSGKKNVKLASFLAHVRAFLNHAQLDKGDTIRRLLTENGVPAGMVTWFDEEQWWNYRNTDLAGWTRAQRNSLRAWVEWAKAIQIIAVEADPLLNQNWYHYDPVGSLDGESVLAEGGSTANYTFTNNDNSHLAAAAVPTSRENYYYDHLNRRVLKQGWENAVFIYDLAGNLIGEAGLDGTIQQEWIYLGSQRLAMIELPHGAGPAPCGVCSLAGGADGGAAFLAFMGLIFVGIGVRYRNRKYTIAGLTFIGGMVFFVLRPEARGLASNGYLYYYHNDHLGTPKVITDWSGALAWDVDLGPFGEPAYNTPVRVSNKFIFPGQYADFLTGWYYNWNRYYMPEVGRYNRVDPIYYQYLISIAYNCKSSNNLSKFTTIFKNTYFSNETHNPYFYANNNPLIKMDYNGLLCVSGGLSGTAALWGGFSVAWQVTCCTDKCNGLKCCKQDVFCFCQGAGASGGGFLNFQKGESGLQGGYSCFRMGGGGAMGGYTYEGGAGVGGGGGPGYGYFNCCCQTSNVNCL